MKKTYTLHYVVLVVLLFLSLLLAYENKGNIGLQMIIAGATAVFYVLWGIAHHAIAGTLHRKIVLEYVLIGLISIVLLLTLAI